MNPTQLDEVRALINLANNLLALLNTLLATNRPQTAQRIVYTGVKFYLQLLVESLEQIARCLAIQEIQEIIHPSFTGNDPLGNPISVLRLLEIRDALETCREGVEEIYPIECIVDLINSPIEPIPEIETALDARLASAGDQALPVPSGYSLLSQTSSEFIFEVMVNGVIQSFTGRISTQPNTSSQSAAEVDTYIWIPSGVFGGFTNTPTPEQELETRLRQSQYGYLALRLAWDLYPQDPSTISFNLKLLLAILYRGELGINTNDIRLEALTRSFLAPNQLCGSALLCTSFDSLANSLSNSQFWYQRTQTVNSSGVVTAFGDYARVRIDGTGGGQGLLNEAHITTLLEDYTISTPGGGQGIGPFFVDGLIATIFSDHLAWLKPPGQRSDSPSKWGNFVERPDFDVDGKTLAEVQTYLRGFPGQSGMSVFEVTTETTNGCTTVFIVTNNVGLSADLLGHC